MQTYTGVAITETVAGLEPNTAYHWRARLLYYPGNRLGQAASRWLYGPGHGMHETDFRTAATTVRTITYTYDPLGRLTDADYSTGESFEYAYDAAGNRAVLTSTTLISGTVVTTYTYEANRLTGREVSDGRVYTYTWSARGQLLSEWTQGVAVRTFAYDGAGRLVEATVFTQTTRFTYTSASLAGAGGRVIVDVVGYGTTTVTLDYAGGNRILAETTITGTTLYLYGHNCLGQYDDAGGWLYYLNDATGLVRQGADEDGWVTKAWLFDPDGTLLEGPEGLVSHLVCGGVYDWSTGLIYKNGGYFDPTLGIWLALAPLVVVQCWRGRKRKGWWKYPWYAAVVLVLVGLGGALMGCESACSLPETMCVEGVKTKPFGPPIGDRACFVSLPENTQVTFPGGSGEVIVVAGVSPKAWENAEMDIVEPMLTDVIVNKYGGSSGFGDYETALTRFGVSTREPILLLRSYDYSPAPGTFNLATGQKPYLTLYDIWFE